MKLCVVALVLTGCVLTRPAQFPLAYVSHPETIQQPRVEIETIVSASNDPREVTTLQFSDGFFTTRTMGPFGTLQMTVRYAEIGRVELFQYGPLFQVAVTNRRAQRTFLWSVASPDDAQRLADAIVAIATPPAPEPTPPPGYPTLGSAIR